MHFDFCIGNPPYQGDNNFLLYPDFFQSAKTVSGCIDMIFPTGWQEPKNAKNLAILNSKEVKEDSQIVLIDNVHNVFPNVSGTEWTNVIIWKKGYDNGYDGKQLIFTDGQNPELKYLLYKKEDVFSTLPLVLRKISLHFVNDESLNLSSIIYSGRSVLKFNDIFLHDYPQSIVARLNSIQKKQPYIKQLCSNEEFELKTSSFEVLDFAFISTQPDDVSHYYKLYGSYHNRRVVRWISKNYMEPRSVTRHNLSCYKVLLAYAASAGDFGAKLSDTIIAGPDESCTPSFIGIGYFSSYLESVNCSKYIKTKLFRTLLGLLKTGRPNPSSVFAYIPIQNFTSVSDIDWSKSVHEIDLQLYKKYGLSDEEIQFIEEKVKPME